MMQIEVIRLYIRGALDHTCCMSPKSLLLRAEVHRMFDREIPWLLKTIET